MIYYVSRISPNRLRPQIDYANRLRTLFYKSFVEKMKLKLSPMDCKTNTALLHTNLQSLYLLCMVYSNIGLQKYTFVIFIEILTETDCIQ